jgi:hypothetical protein
MILNTLFFSFHNGPVIFCNLMKRVTGIFLISFLFYFPLFSQDTIRHLKVPAKILNGDTLPFVDIDSASVFSPPPFVSRKEKIRFDRLVYNVRIVYPFAKLAGLKLREYRDALEKIPSEKARKEYIKKAEKELETMFGNQIRDLTFNQGKILIKLIYRETGSSSFDIVKGLRGGFSAFIWQTLAVIFGYDLKTKYDPEGGDKAIEMIVKAIDNGEI